LVAASCEGLHGPTVFFWVDADDTGRVDEVGLWCILDVFLETLDERVRVDYARFWAPECGGYGRRETRLHCASFFSINQTSRYSRGRKGTDPEPLSYRVKALDVVSLVLVSDDELPGLSEGDAVGLTSVVEKMSSADAKSGFERFRGVI
jgi:hypothetical protein